MIDFLINNPLLLLFLVAAIGYPLGQLKIAGNSLGVAAVLFVGLAFGALDPNLKVPTVVYEMGLILFVYTVGLGSGRSFVEAFKRSGLRDNLFVFFMLVLGCGGAVAVKFIFNLKTTFAVGMFTGSFTNTPAMAASVDFLRGNSKLTGAALDQLAAEPVVGYSVAYPMGVIGMLLAIAIMQRVFKIDYAKEANQHPELGASGFKLKNETVLITNPEVVGKTIAQLITENRWKVVFGRLKRGRTIELTDGGTILEKGDLLGVIGTDEDLSRVVPMLGEASSEHLELTRSSLDYRRVFVSNRAIVGRKLSELHLQQNMGLLITRIRRGDREFLPTGDTVLALGDRVRVVAHREQMDKVSAYFGDSFVHISEINFMTFSLGLVLGLLLGSIPIPLPGGVNLKLGQAGGPLIVALILSAFERTGPLVWTLPYNANLTLRQVGAVFLLAGIGTRAGYPFRQTITAGPGLALFVGGAVITCIIAFSTLFIGYKLLKIPMGLLTGMLGGLQTQPAVLSFARDQADNELPNLGYSTVYATATIVKLVLAQLLLALLL